MLALCLHGKYLSQLHLLNRRDGRKFVFWESFGQKSAFCSFLHIAQISPKNVRNYFFTPKKCGGRLSSRQNSRNKNQRFFFSKTIDRSIDFSAKICVRAATKKEKICTSSAACQCRQNLIQTNPIWLTGGPAAHAAETARGARPRVRVPVRSRWRRYEYSHHTFGEGAASASTALSIGPQACNRIEGRT